MAETYMQLILICNEAATATAAVNAGVDCIMVDLERTGKFARQGHRNTYISDHVVADVARMRAAAPDATLLVRIDPWGSAGVENQVEEVVAEGADVLMLPMIQGVADVATLCAQVAARAGVMPLIETIRSANAIREIAAMSGVSALYVGLNDLHMELNRTFMFELLSDGTIESLANQVRQQGKPFGFGGIARIGRGELPAESILAEHYRIGSRAVILSRQFRATSNHDFSWEHEIGRIRETERRLTARSEREQASDRDFVCRRVREIVAKHNDAGTRTS